MMEALGQILQLKILGPILIVTLFALWHQTKQLARSQEKRVQDMRSLTDSYMKLGGKYTAALNANTRAIDAQQRQMDEVRRALQAFEESD